MTRRIVRATRDERSAYSGLYPVYGFITISGKRCAVEDLRGCGGSDNPRYEVLAPPSMHFTEEGLHSLLCANMDDLRTRVAVNDLIACGPNC